MNRIIFTTTITNLHVGTGQGVGSVDLPIARERATMWPVIPGSSFKGVLRDRARLEETKSQRTADKDTLKDADKNIAYLYGSTSDESASAGALAFSDQRIIAFPVRSLQGTFVLATCEMAISRLNELGAVAGLARVEPIRVAEDDRCKVSQGAEVIDGSKVFLEDQDFEADVTDLGSLIQLLRLSAADESFLRHHLVVVSNTTFTYLTESATEITTKVSLEFSTKTAKDGFLRTEETVPPMAVFAGVVLANPMRGEDREKVSMHLDGLKTAFVQLGAKASTGLGICRVNAVGGGAQ
jgi:CRISPR-associated protein Cmr4